MTLADTKIYDGIPPKARQSVAISPDRFDGSAEVISDTPVLVSGSITDFRGNSTAHDITMAWYPIPPKQQKITDDELQLD